MSEDNKTTEHLWPWDERKPERVFSAYYYGFDPTGSSGVDAVLKAVAFAGQQCHNTEDWGRHYEGRSMVGWIQRAADVTAARHLAEIQGLHEEMGRLHADLVRIRENADCVISGSLADHLAAAEVRDAFDAGAKAMWDAILADNMVVNFVDITKLPGRPGPKKTEEGDA